MPVTFHIGLLMPYGRGWSRDSAGESRRNAFVALTVSMMIDGEGADHTLWCPTPGESVSSEDDVERLCGTTSILFSVFKKQALE